VEAVYSHLRSSSRQLPLPPCKHLSLPFYILSLDKQVQGSSNSSVTRWIRAGRNRELASLDPATTRCEVDLMRAAVLRSPGSQLVIEELSVDGPGPNEVLVKVAACGVCHSDLHYADGDWGKPEPTVLGHEVSGVVVDLGSSVTSLAKGQHVIVNWYYPCLLCNECQAGRPWICSGTTALDNQLPGAVARLHAADGRPVNPYLAVGGFAELVVVPAQAAIPIPDQMPLAPASLIGCCVTTGVMAVHRTANVRLGQSLVVIGLGGVGLSIVMGAVLAGASPIVAVDRVPSKVNLALELGASVGLVATADDQVLEALKDLIPQGPDYIFEAIGSPTTIELSATLVPRGGKLILVGLSALGQHVTLDPFAWADGSRELLGANYGRAIPALDFPVLCRLFLAGKLPVERLIDSTIPLESINLALDSLRTGASLRKIIVPTLEE
jgi:S-(hydroxymethyl)glutathione dehydrogenase/alcohol dehydrogenase